MIAIVIPSISGAVFFLDDRVAARNSAFVVRIRANGRGRTKERAIVTLGCGLPAPQAHSGGVGERFLPCSWIWSCPTSPERWTKAFAHPSLVEGVAMSLPPLVLQLLRVGSRLFPSPVEDVSVAHSAVSPVSPECRKYLIVKGSEGFYLVLGYRISLLFAP